MVGTGWTEVESLDGCHEEPGLSTKRVHKHLRDTSTSYRNIKKPLLTMNQAIQSSLLVTILVNRDLLMHYHHSKYRQVLSRCHPSISSPSSTMYNTWLTLVHYRDPYISQPSFCVRSSLHLDLLIHRRKESLTSKPLPRNFRSSSPISAPDTQVSAITTSGSASLLLQAGRDYI